MLEDRVRALEVRLAALEDRVVADRAKGRPGRIPIPAVPVDDLEAATVRVAQIMSSAERSGSGWWVQFGHENPELRRQVQEWTRGVRVKVESSQ